MTDALIGYTGFVGSCLDRSHAFGDRFNSKNFREMSGRRYDLLVCAGVSAAKWIANREPEEDRRQIAALTAVLDTVSAREFVLISTIDVYPDPTAGGDETTVIDPSCNHAYGRHRYELEQWVRGRFACARTVRLPALFGPGLKKNALYDLLNNNQVDRINPAASYQWYPLTRLWADIEIVRQQGLDLANLFPESLAMRAIIDRCFAGAKVGPAVEPAPHYRVGTVHAAAFGGRPPYIMDAHACLEAIVRYVADVHSKGEQA
jgi:hypothetical protein